MAAKQGDTVKVNYTGTLENGEIFDSSKGRDPLKFTLGSGQVIPGFESAVIGMECGEKKSVRIPCDLAYGDHNPDMIIEAPLEHVPADLEPERGMVLEVGGPNGELLRAIVVKISDTHIHLDANPPLAGKDLNFDLELVEII